MEQIYNKTSENLHSNANIEPKAKVFQKRQTAYKVKIKDILDGSYVREDGMIPNHIKIKDKDVSRVNLIGAIVLKSDDLGFTLMSLDDGSGKVNLRSFDTSSFPDIQIGDLVLNIGRVREYNNEKFIVPEIIKKMDNPLWIKVRDLELKSSLKEDASDKKDILIAEKNKVIVEEEIVKNDQDLKPNSIEQIILLIRKLDQGNGVDIDEVIKKSSSLEAEKLIHSLLIQGDLFEVKPGRIKILE